MGVGVRLLELAEEYRVAKANRDEDWGVPGTPLGRDPEVIAADYEAAVLELVTQRV